MKLAILSRNGKLYCAMTNNTNRTASGSNGVDAANPRPNRIVGDASPGLLAPEFMRQVDIDWTLHDEKMRQTALLFNRCRVSMGK